MRRFHLLFGALTFLVVAVPGFAEPTEAPQDPASMESAETAEVAGGAGADELAWDQLDDPAYAADEPVPGAPADAAPTPMSEAQADAAPMAVPEAQADTVPMPMDDLTADATAPMEAAAAAVPEMEAPADVIGDASIEASVQLTSAPGFETSGGIVLGPQGIDDQGRRGRLHTVSKGDTLWDLAAAYLGTAWVWPSVWIDNDDIDNPHLIIPGDRIWITANEMRVVTEAEAESFLAPVPAEEEMASGDIGDAFMTDATEGIDDTAGLEEVPPLAALEAEADDPSTLDAFPVAVEGQETAAVEPGRMVTVSRRDAMGFVSEDDVAGASSIVDSPVERTFLAAGDRVVLGMGEGDVEIGDRFTIFDTIEVVRDVESNRILGHHVEILGWLEVKELTGETAIAEIRESYAMVTRGSRIMGREIAPRRVTSRQTPDAIEGKIVFMPSQRTEMADGGYVYLNRGEFHGVEVGSELEVFDPGAVVNDRVRRVDVRTPDHSVARLVVVTVTAESSVAFVLTSTRELVVGDDVRPRTARLAQR